MLQGLERLRANIAACFYGNQQAIDKVLVCLLAKGHLLIEDVPGVGKTTLAISVAKSLDAKLARVQMTPDLMPSDILGISVWDQSQGAFTFKPGPIFTNVLLADEINRTTPRTQSALLEAMNESQVTVDGRTHRLLAPFFVIATQNPFEFEGTYFLPESQLDRFLMRIKLGYPAPDDESRVLIDDPHRTALAELEPVMPAQGLVELQAKVDEVRMDRVLVDYIVALANATRSSDLLEVGVSPRGTLALSRAAKAAALIDGRDYCTPDDITSHVVPVFAHRCVSRGYSEGTLGTDTTRTLRQIMETVPSPV